jgi:hypothetical protein
MLMAMLFVFRSSCALNKFQLNHHVVIDMFNKKSQNNYHLDLSTLTNKKVADDCRRFATVPISPKHGLGHKFGEVIFGMLLAEATNSTYVFNDTNLYGSGTHGSYEWFRSFLPLSKTEYTWDEYQREMIALGTRDAVESTTFDDVLNNVNHTKCNVFLSASSKSC